MPRAGTGKKQHLRRQICRLTRANSAALPPAKKKKLQQFSGKHAWQGACNQSRARRVLFGTSAPVMNEISSFSANTPVPAPGSVVAVSEADGATSVFAALVAQMQNTEASSAANAQTTQAPGSANAPQLQSATGPQTASEILAAAQAEKTDPNIASTQAALQAISIVQQPTQLPSLINVQLTAQGSAEVQAAAVRPPETNSRETTAEKLQLLATANQAASSTNDPQIDQLLAAATIANPLNHPTPPASAATHKKSASEQNAIAGANATTQPMGSNEAVEGKMPAVPSSSLDNQQGTSGQSLGHAFDPAKGLEGTAAGQTNAAASQPAFSAELQKLQPSTSDSSSQPPVPLDALAVRIARKFDQGSSQFEISLHPAELGKLDISLNVTEDGRLHAVIRAERADTLDLLKQDARQLETQLRQAGLEVGSNSLSFQLSQGGSQRQATKFTDFGNAFDAESNSGRSEEVKFNYIAVRKRDGVDIHV